MPRPACRRGSPSTDAASRCAPRACRSCPPYRELGYEAAARAGREFAIGSAGAGLGATTVNLQGGLGSASAVCEGFTVGALAAVNAAGSAVVGAGPWFWAAPFEEGTEYG